MRSSLIVVSIVVVGLLVVALAAQAGPKMREKIAVGGLMAVGIGGLAAAAFRAWATAGSMSVMFLSLGSGQAFDAVGVFLGLLAAVLAFGTLFVVGAFRPQR